MTQLKFSDPRHADPQVFRDDGRWSVMAKCETGEVFCHVDRQTKQAALDWIEANADNYPESRFWIEIEPYWS